MPVTRAPSDLSRAQRALRAAENATVMVSPSK